MVVHLYDGLQKLGSILNPRYNAMKNEITGEFKGELNFKYGSQVRPLSVWVNNRKAIINAYVMSYPDEFTEIVVSGVRVKDPNKPTK